MVRRVFAVAIVAAHLGRLASASPHSSLHEHAQRYRASQPYVEDYARRRPSSGAGLNASEAHVYERLLQDEASCEDIYAHGTWGHLRIGYELIGSADATAEFQSKIMDIVMARAVSYWSNALEVIRSTAPLRAERAPTSEACLMFPFEGDKHGDSYFVCGAATAPTCGPDAIPIPDEYLRSYRVCNDRCSPAYTCSGACYDAATESCACKAAADQGDYCCEITAGDDCPQDCSAQTASYEYDPYLLCQTCTDLPAGAGVANTDMHILVTIRDSASCVSSEGLTAYTSSCVQDQCDRPIFATLNFCPSMMSLDSEEDINNQVTVAIHELAHALAFSGSLFRYFRNSDGSPRIPRSASDPFSFQSEVRWSCANGVATFPDDNGRRLHVDIAPELVSVVPTRDLDECQCPLNGVSTLGAKCIVANAPAFQEPYCVTAMSTPRVVEEARSYFDCDTLVGAELENQDTSTCAIVGEHWESRIFKQDIMATHLSQRSRVSRVTLAVFEDSGWYRVNYSWADDLLPGLHWGYKEGCAFATEKCVDQGVSNSPKHFCTDTNSRRCSWDRTSTAMCSIKEVANDSRFAWQLPVSLKYFTEGNDFLGDAPELDYCPVFDTIASNRICTNADTAETRPYETGNAMREIFGSSSRCLMSTLRGSWMNGDLTYTPVEEHFAEPMPTCYQVLCSAAGDSYVVSIDKPGTVGPGSVVMLGTCTSADQQLDQQDLSGTIVCADPLEMCHSEVVKHYQAPEQATEPTSPPTPAPSSAPTAQPTSISPTPAAPTQPTSTPAPTTLPPPTSIPSPTGSAASESVAPTVGDASAPTKEVASLPTLAPTSGAIDSSPMPPKSNSASGISVSMTVENVDYGALNADANLIATFKATVRQTIASEAGSQITEEHVSVELSAGSVKVDATVIAPSGVATSTLKTNLVSSASTTLGQAIVASVNQIDGIDAVANGEISVSRVSEVAVFTASPTLAPTLGEPTRSSTLAPTLTPVAELDVSSSIQVNSARHQGLFVVVLVTCLSAPYL